MKNKYTTFYKLELEVFLLTLILCLFSCQKMSSSLQNTDQVAMYDQLNVDGQQTTLEDYENADKILDLKNQNIGRNFHTNDDQALEANIIYVQKKFKDLEAEKIFLLANYLTYIKLSPEQPGYNDEVSRLANSSLEFIFCPSFDDIICLEGNTTLKAAPDMRKDALPDLSNPIYAGQKLSIEYYFTQGWYQNYMNKSKNFIMPENTVAKKLGEKISRSSNKSIYLAMYGIDDMEDSMSPVFKAIQQQSDAGKNVKAVVDVNDSPQPNSFVRDYNIEKSEDNRFLIKPISQPLDYSYFKPSNPEAWAFGAPLWTETYLNEVSRAGEGLNKTELKSYLVNSVLAVDPSFIGNSSAAIADLVWIGLNLNLMNYNETFSRMAYGYKGSHALLSYLNRNITSNEESNLRVEYPYSGIMHNKFVILESKQGRRSVWTGTANISRTCMGSEENANMSIHINNDHIAQAFKDEFFEMFNPYQDPSRPSTLMTGAFHNRKRPNTNRYFVFGDKTELRVHFSPTDDAEHKVILPLIYSAKEGDIIRISMFGNSGYELVRALQSAVARGVHIKIAVDKLTGLQSGSWIKNTTANLFEKNPFVENPKGILEIRKNEWSGLNHHKTATLTRKLPNGKYRPETIVIGSQNWSKSGNDLNDENVVTITNKQKGLVIMHVYNREFDNKIWIASSPVDLPPSIPLPTVTNVQGN
jgi:PLD-like domain